jgi:hypothetical protein
MAERSCNEDEAAAYMDETDARRSDFVRRHFHRDPLDPHNYDMIINTESLDPVAAASMVAVECRRRFPKFLAPASAAI